MALNGKVALVTGGGAGIGRAYALALAGAGATVVAVARRLGSPDNPAPNTLAEVAQAGADLPGKIHIQVCDMEIEADIVRAVDRTVADFGRLDILVNSAAFMKSFDPFQIDTDMFDRMMRINLRGPYLAIRQAAPVMMRQRSGSIINITARAGQFVPKGDHASDNTLLYGLTKAGLNRLTYYMAEELKEYGIAVNALSPGIVRSESMLKARPDAEAQGIGKPCTPEVMGPALLYLAQQTAETMTGQILHTDAFGKEWP